MPNIGGIVKTLQNIMRKDQGVSGDAQRIEQLGWIRIEGHRPEYNFLLLASGDYNHYESGENRQN